MRPVLLEMNGFVSFREKTEVSFLDTDYFALVGPTGAGKSTVIDALAFALYGSVARWDHEGMVAPALAPTSNRGTVRLVFDAAGARYQVAREIRRSSGKNANVSIKNSRLERFDDHNALGSPDDVTHLMAADSEVTPAVTTLLGLTFKHFCTCVALPQGDFAEFLHAKASERQKILSKLLGFEVYERIARRAGDIAGQQRQRVDILKEQLGGYTDANADVLGRLATRMDVLDELGLRVEAALPALGAAEDDHVQARERVAILDGEIGLLQELRQPQGVEELDTRQRAATDALDAAKTALSSAESADQAARGALTAAPDRHGLEQIRTDRAQLAQLDGALPDLRDSVETATKTRKRLAAELSETELDVARKRDQNQRARVTAEGARAEADRVRQERDDLAGLREPADVADLAARADDIARRMAQAKVRVTEAESADADARRASAAQPDAGILARALGDARELHEHCSAQEAALPTYATHRASLDLAGTELRRLENELADLDKEVSEAEQDDHAAALRVHLHVGQPCPVCEQSVLTIPSGTATADLSALRDRLERTRDRRDKAAADLGQAQRLVDRDSDAHATAIARAEQSRQAIAARAEAGTPALLRQPVTVTQTTDDLAGVVEAASAAIGRLENAQAERERATHAEEAARLKLDEARRARDALASETDRHEKQLAVARAFLQSARDPLVALGVPPLAGDDVVTSWARLLDWASTEADLRAKTLETLEPRAEAAARDASAAAENFASAEEAVEHKRAELRRADLAEQIAVTEHDRATARRQGLFAKLTEAPSADAVESLIAEALKLEQEASAADAELATARSGLKEAVEAEANVGRRVAVELRQLLGARDTVVALGAPPVGEANLLDAWQTLMTWAAKEGDDRRARLATAEHDASVAADALRQVEQGLANEVRAHDVSLDEPGGGKGVRDLVRVALAEARTRAEADHAEMKRRVAQAERLRTEMDAAETEAGVAKLLAYNLRIDKFPRWLISSALDILVTEASVVLRELSGDQFELTHENGDFLVVDHNEADAKRRVKTLSGGETFQASLALALALSSQLGALATEGAARLESIFLDEGFGTLDEATLDVVASTLENLAAAGTRMVGVVTHVPALAERVPVRFRVSRDGAGSHVTREMT